MYVQIGDSLRLTALFTADSATTSALGGAHRNCGAACLQMIDGRESLVHLGSLISLVSILMHPSIRQIFKFD